MGEAGDDVWSRKEIFSPLADKPFPALPLLHSYADSLSSEKGMTGPADFYISHSLGRPFLGLVDQVLGAASIIYPEREATTEVFVWISGLCRKKKTDKGGAAQPASIMSTVFGTAWS